MQRIAVGRIIGLIVALLGLGSALHFARNAAQQNADYHQWFEDHPLYAEVDFSKPGEFTLPFHQTCNVSHGAGVCLAITPLPEKPITPAELAKGLSGRIVVEDSAGQKLDEASIDIEFYNQGNSGLEIALADIDPMIPRGEYRATIHIDAGAPTLAGKRQVLYAKYFLCGLEQYPAIIGGVISFIAGAVGFVVAALIFPGLWEYGWRRAPISDELA